MNHPTLANNLEQYAIEGNSDDYPKPNNLIPVTSCPKNIKKNLIMLHLVQGTFQITRKVIRDRAVLRWTYLKLVTFLYNIKLQNPVTFLFLHVTNVLCHIYNLKFCELHPKKHWSMSSQCIYRAYPTVSQTLLQGEHADIY